MTFWAKGMVGLEKRTGCPVSQMGRVPTLHCHKTPGFQASSISLLYIHQPPVIFIFQPEHQDLLSNSLISPPLRWLKITLNITGPHTALDLFNSKLAVLFTSLKGNPVLPLVRIKTLAAILGVIKNLAGLHLQLLGFKPLEFLEW